MFVSNEEKVRYLELVMWIHVF
ncbi:Os04g0313301 [Oryza sativa Japonica Group]|uniref:Os04g0313301 protein n=1 Tax=Oryza sativa subsp. japonica TaxID=39947 RepID=A0A0P0W8F9_ORYSJ|nr:Os04g0313301 [Oryza sativa Japonica Group]